MMTRILKFATLLLLLSSSAWAQGSRYDGIALGVRGPVPFATVAVCSQPTTTTTTPCSPLITTYTDTTLGTSSANPLTADALGNFHFYAATGKYTVQIYSPQISPAFVQADQILSCDPSNCVVASITARGLTPGRCLQSSTDGLIAVAAGACTTGAGTIGGSTVNGRVAVGTTSNNLTSFSNFLYDGTNLSIPSLILNGITFNARQGNTATIQTAGTNSGVAGAALCNDANGNTTTTGCTTITPTGLVWCSPVSLVGDVSVSASVLTSITSLGCTMPSSGCPCRVDIRYNMSYTTGASNTLTDFYITDGTNVFAAAEGIAGAAPVPRQGATGSDYSPVTYANGAVLTFTLNVKSNQNITVKAAPANGVGPNSGIRALVISSN